MPCGLLGRSLGRQLAQHSAREAAVSAVSAFRTGFCDNGFVQRAFCATGFLFQHPAFVQPAWFRLSFFFIRQRNVRLATISSSGCRGCTASSTTGFGGGATAISGRLCHNSTLIVAAGCVCQVKPKYSSAKNAPCTAKVSIPAGSR